MLPCYGVLNLPGRMCYAGGAPDSDEDSMILKILLRFGTFCKLSKICHSECQRSDLFYCQCNHFAQLFMAR